MKLTRVESRKADWTDVSSLKGHPSRAAFPPSIMLGRSLMVALPWAVSAVVFGGIAALTLLTVPPADTDETGLFNPVYLFVHTGKMSYPIYYMYDSMVVHPPVHYMELGELMKLGMSFAYAETIPTLTFASLILLLLCKSDFEYAVKLGLAFGLFGAITLYLPGGYFSLHGVRPDLHLALAWFAGLVALESGRMAGWDLKRIGLGSFLLTYASGLHYFGVVAFTGIAVYVAWAVISLRRAAWAKIGVMCGSALVFGLPYVAFFVVPEWTGIRQMAAAVQGTGGVGEAIARQYAQYQTTSWLLQASSAPLPLVSALTVPVLEAKVPLVCVGTLLLLLFRSTRGMALAALPLQLFVLLYSQGKSVGYYLPELLIYCGATAATFVALVALGLRLIRWNGVRQAGLPVAGLVLVASVAYGTPRLESVDLTRIPLIHPMDVARAAGRQIVGPDAFVAGRIGLWYASGEEVWHEIESDVLWRPVSNIDLTAYFSQFDAIADQYHMSNASSNDRNATLSSWYVDHTLNVSGFYFADTNASPLSYLLFNPKPQGPLVGFASDKSLRLVRFDEQNAGSWAFVTLNCPQGSSAKLHVSPQSYSNMLLLPSLAAAPPREVTTLLEPVAELTSEQDSLSECQIRDQRFGRISPADVNAMVAELGRDDQPIAFVRRVEQALATLTIANQPSDGVVSGGTVETTVTAHTRRSDMATLVVSVNTDQTGQSSGDWTTLGELPASGRSTTGQLNWSTAGLQPGSHLVAVNIVLTNGDTIYYYDLPPQTYVVR